ncbi:MAG: Gfo/Idh/MocA family oxidoreductase [Chloroflexi bacterium]|nr:Gfo/Idh/MocA family oxidoreductase [Chloroflexota bacterium]
MTHTRPYRVGVIGTSWAARVPLPTFASFEGTEVTAICSARAERASEAARRFGARLAGDDYRALIESPEVDIVYIGAPVARHREMALAAAAAGKHILCEKPLALDAAEACEMLGAARDAGVAHVTSFFVRPFESHRYVKELVASGDLGEPRQLSVTHFPGWQRGAWSWLDSSAEGGGYLGAVGSHYIDLARDWLGEFATVSAQLRTWVGEAGDAEGLRRPVDADDAFLLAGSMRQGALVSIQFSRNVPPGRGRRIELYGSEGAVVIDGDEVRGEARVYRSRRGERAPREVELPPSSLPDTVRESAVPIFGAMIHTLLDFIESGRSEGPTFEDGLRCQEVLDAARLSAAEGRVVAVSETVSETQREEARR